MKEERAKQQLATHQDEQASSNFEGFPLGRIYSTPGSLEVIPAEELLEALERHAQGDWGEVDREDWWENDFALGKHLRLFSVYYTREARRKFWIITEADRSVTTVLLPEEY